MSAPDWMVKKVAQTIYGRFVLSKAAHTWEQAEEAARAVLDLAGPQRLVWRGKLQPTAHPYFIEPRDNGTYNLYFGSWRGQLAFGLPTLEAAQAAAQAHADEAWWSQTKAAKERDDG